MKIEDYPYTKDTVNAKKLTEIIVGIDTKKGIVRTIRVNFGTTTINKIEYARGVERRGKRYVLDSKKGSRLYSQLAQEQSSQLKSLMDQVA